MYWTTINKTSIGICDMDIKHIYNSIDWLQRQINKDVNKIPRIKDGLAYLTWIAIFKAEINRRKQIKITFKTFI